MNSQLLFALVGTACGIAYAVLGLRAIRHIRPELGPTDIDRYVGWTLWWCLEWRRYTEVGRRLCFVGGLVLLLGATSWIAWVKLQ